ncbi:MAG TPA: hypothetical protein VFD58_06205 [Blastocatellia bacterium]|nr:hypothetical protein [Blastocatellia bacterium]
MTRKRIALVCLILAGIIALPAAVMRAQSNEGAGRPEMLAKELDAQFEGGGWIERLRELQSQQLEGSWDVTATPVVPPGVPQPPSIITHGTFSRGGALFGSDRTRPFSKQHGTWAHLGGNEFASIRTEDLFDAAGNFTGTFKVRARTIVTGKDEFVGVANVEQRDAAGNLVFNLCARFRGQRITIEPLAPQCQSINPFQ